MFIFKYFLTGMTYKKELNLNKYQELNICLSLVQYEALTSSKLSCFLYRIISKKYTEIKDWAQTLFLLH